MEVIENATRLKACLLECADDPTRPGWLRVSVEVRQAGPVADLPSLVDARAGETLAVLVGPADRDKVAALKPGRDIALQVRLRAPGVLTALPGTLAAD